MKDLPSRLFIHRVSSRAEKPHVLGQANHSAGKQEADLTLGLCDLYTLLHDHVSVPRSPDFAGVAKFKSHVQRAVEF